MPTLNVTLHRKLSKQVNRDTIKQQIDYIAKRAVSGDRSQWSCKKFTVPAPKNHAGAWLYEVELKFERPSRKRIGIQNLPGKVAKLLEVVKESGANTKFNPSPWYVVKHTSDVAILNPVGITSAPADPNAPMNVGDVVNFSKALTLDDIEIPEVLINGTDEEIEAHPAFEGIYDRAAHIRVMFSSIKTMKDTKGMRRNHVILHGLPACAKSSLFMGMQKVLPVGSYLKLNANSTTRAGIEEIFLGKLKVTGVPPIIFNEELEKTLEAILTTWLSILDERAEVRKLNFRTSDQTEARVLCFATANDKLLFDRLMGGRPGHPGAISSRFTKSLYVPRPSWNVMEKILLRDIKRYGGKEDWAPKCIDIAKEMGTNDPRTVLSYLDGGDRLMDGSYKADLLRIGELEKQDKKEFVTLTKEELDGPNSNSD